MRRISLKGMTVAQLRDRFVEIGLAEDLALLDEDYSKFNKLYDLMLEVDDELKTRGRIARLALTRLFDHPNAQVRLKAATATLAIAPKDAREVMEAIIEMKEFPQAGDAGMLLDGLDDGSFKPT